MPAAAARELGDVLTRALAESVAFVHGQAFYVDHAGDRELRLCFSSVPVGRADEVARRLLRAIAAVRRETGRVALADGDRLGALLQLALMGSGLLRREMTGTCESLPLSVSIENRIVSPSTVPL